MPDKELLIDADGHVCEPPDMWERYIDPKFRGRGLHIVRDERGFETIEIDGRRARATKPGALATVGGMGKLGPRVAEMAAKRRAAAATGPIPLDASFMPRPTPEDTYLLSVSYGAMDPKERLDVIDRDGLDKALLYPTLGLNWECETEDVELSQAYCRAHNRWIAEFCRGSDGRMIPIAHISMGDPQEAAREIRRAAKDGCRGVFVLPFTITRIPHGHPDHDPIFAVCEELDLPFGIHPGFESWDWDVHQRFNIKRTRDIWMTTLCVAQGMQQAFASMFQFGVFDRFPGLKVVVLESGAGWIGWWLERADAIYEHSIIGGSVRLREKPSFYFRRQCYISADPDERATAAIIPLVGEDKFFWASDFPHVDHPGNYIEEIHELATLLSPAAARGIKGENVARAYGLL